MLFFRLFRWEILILRRGTARISFFFCFLDSSAVLDASSTDFGSGTTSSNSSAEFSEEIPKLLE